MEISTFFKHATLVITLSFVIPVHNSYQTFSEEHFKNTIIGYIALYGIGATTIGTGLSIFGIVKLCNIPITSAGEIALALQNNLSNEDLKKIRLGRRIIAYPAIGIGALLALAGIILVIKAPTLAEQLKF